jgi:hypothetical protein
MDFNILKLNLNSFIYVFYLLILETENMSPEEILKLDIEDMKNPKNKKPSGKKK